MSDDPDIPVHRHAIVASASSGTPRKSRHRLDVLLISGLLAGCSVGPAFKPPAGPTETKYESGWTPALPNVAGEPAQHFVIGKQLTADWWTLFHSRPLDTVVKQALAGNPDLAAAEANLTAAQEIANAARGSLYPQIDFAAGVERQRQNYAAFGLALPPTTFNTFSIGPSVSYSLDPFGKNRSLIEQRTAQANVQRYQRDAAYLALTGNVVSDAVRIASLHAQIQAVSEVLREDEHTLALARQRASVGVVSETDVAQAEAQLSSDRMTLPPLQQQLSVARHRLSTLVGKTPAQWSPPAFSLDSLVLPAEIPLTLPSKLAHRRPDILAAEAELHAASAAVGAATAALYPDITLTGGIEQIAAASLLSWPATVWNLGAGLTAPVFHGGALAAQKRAAQANYVAATQTYRRTVLHAFAQVADVLDALRHDTALLSAADQTLKAANHALYLTRQNYSVGAIALIDLLNAERVRQHALLAKTRAQAQRYLDTADLFLAMGGGWWNQPNLKSAPRETKRTAAREALQ